jgi:hypothetical protein
VLKTVCLAVALAVASAATLNEGVDAASFSAPEVTSDTLVSLIAAKKKKTKKYRARRCKKGRVYSKKRGKCVVAKRTKARAKAKRKSA